MCRLAYVLQVNTTCLEHWRSLKNLKTKQIFILATSISRFLDYTNTILLGLTHFLWKSTITHYFKQYVGGVIKGRSRIGVICLNSSFFLFPHSMLWGLMKHYVIKFNFKNGTCLKYIKRNQPEEFSSLHISFSISHKKFSFIFFLGFGPTLGLWRMSMVNGELWQKSLNKKDVRVPPTTPRSGSIISCLLYSSIAESSQWSPLTKAFLVHLSFLLYVVYCMIAKLEHNAFIIFIVPTFS